MNTFGLPFDHNSVMMYSKGALSVDGSITIRTRDPLAQDVIGTASNPSSIDWLRLCSLYNCSRCAGHPFARNTSGDCPEDMLPIERPKCIHLSLLVHGYGYFESTCCKPRPDPPEEELTPRSFRSCSYCLPAPGRLACNSSLILSHPSYWADYCCGHCGESRGSCGTEEGTNELQLTGAQWLEGWCNSLDAVARRERVEQTVCPPDYIPILTSTVGVSVGVNCSTCQLKPFCRHPPPPRPSSETVHSRDAQYSFNCCLGCDSGTWRHIRCARMAAEGGTGSGSEYAQWEAMGYCPFKG